MQLTNVLLAASLALACSGRGKAQPPPAGSAPQVTAAADERLPTGCGVVARLDLHAAAKVPAFRTLTQRLLGAFAGGSLTTLQSAGIDPERDFASALLCQAERGVFGPKDMAVVLSGHFPADLMDRMGAAKHGFRRETVEGVAVLAKGRLWVARRTRGDLIVATGSALLAAVLVGPPREYAVKKDALLSVVLTGQALQDTLSGDRGVRAAEINAVKEVQVNLDPQAAGAAMRFVVGDAPAAARLTTALEGMLAALRDQLGKAGSGASGLTIAQIGGDVEMRLPIATGTFDRLLATFAAKAAARTTTASR